MNISPVNYSNQNYLQNSQSFGMAMKYKGTGKSALEKAARNFFDTSTNKPNASSARVQNLRESASCLAKKITDFNRDNYLHHVEVEEVPSGEITVRILQDDKECSSTRLYPNGKNENLDRFLQVIHLSIDEANKLTEDACKNPVNILLNAIG